MGKLGRLIGRIEEGKGEAYASKMDVRCSDRNRIIAYRSILIATGGMMTCPLASVQSLGLSPVRSLFTVGYLIQADGWSVHQCSFGKRDIVCYSLVFPQRQRVVLMFLSATVARATVVAVLLFPQPC